MFQGFGRKAGGVKKKEKSRPLAIPRESPGLAHRESAYTRQARVTDREEPKEAEASRRKLDVALGKAPSRSRRSKERRVQGEKGIQVSPPLVEGGGFGEGRTCGEGQSGSQAGKSGGRTYLLVRKPSSP